MQSPSKLLTMGLILGALASCGQSQSPFPHTGDETNELLVSASVTSREFVEEGRTYYITTNGLNVRSSDSLGNNVVGRLNRNDRVRVINSSENFSGNFVQIEIIGTSSTIQDAERYFVSFEYISERSQDWKEFTGTYFMVQNVATEKLRVYERVCADNSCPHRMVLETNVVVGEDTPGEKTDVGSYRISAWRKFYQDHAAQYPSWYDPTYPELPPPGRGFSSWLRKKLMPIVDGEPKGEMRGAFGWYTALVEPNHNAQWTHGTIGWGADKQRFIDKTKRLLPNLFTSPRSHGCTRTDNETIAYLRQILPVGTPLIKIYAVERLADPNRTGYSQTPMLWNYALTTRGVRVDGQKSDRAEVMASGIQPHEIIEQGTYEVNQWPEVIEFTDDIGRWSRKLGQKGNVYGVPGEDMRGVFYIDTGLLVNYAHPQGLGVGGFRDEVVPPFMDGTVIPLRR